MTHVYRLLAHVLFSSYLTSLRHVISSLSITNERLKWFVLHGSSLIRSWCCCVDFTVLMDRGNTHLSLIITEDIVLCSIFFSVSNVLNKNHLKIINSYVFVVVVDMVLYIVCPPTVEEQRLMLTVFPSLKCALVVPCICSFYLKKMVMILMNWS